MINEDIRRTVCVILPTFNRQEYISECIKSILDQTLRPDRIIVIDDGSTDGTVDILKNFSSQIEVYSKENGGRASAINYGVSLSNEDLIWIADDDDVALKDGLESLYNAHLNSPDAAFIYGDYMSFNSNAPIMKLYSPHRRWVNDSSAKIRFLYGMYSFQFAMLIKRDIFIGLHGMKEDFPRSADYEFSLRMTRFNEAVYINKIIFLQRHHDGDRGRPGQRFSSNEIERNGMKYDSIAFLKVLKTYNLLEFCPSHAASLSIREREFASLLYRGLLSLKFGFWQNFITDIYAASNTVGDATPLINVSKIANGFLKSTLPFEIIAKDSRAIREIRSLYLSGGCAQLVVMEVSGVLIWKAKEYFFGKDFKQFFSLLRICCGILGWRGLLERIIKSILK